MRGLGGSLLRGDKLNDFAEAKERLERTAAGAQHASSLGVFAVACDAGGTCEALLCSETCHYGPGYESVCINIAINVCRASRGGTHRGVASLDEHHAEPGSTGSRTHLHNSAAVAWQPKWRGRLANFHPGALRLRIHVESCK